MSKTAVVVTLTRNRPHLLREAIVSVAKQLHGPVKHFVVADRCDYLSESSLRRELQTQFPGLEVVSNDSRVDSYLPTHLARLRLRAVRAAQADYVALLDDDNTFESSHVSTLIETALSAKVDAAHSWRSLWFRSGNPWVLAETDPWVPDKRLAEISFRRLVEAGVYVPGSNVVRDSFSHGNRMGRVDTNEWFLTRDLFTEFAQPSPPSRAERRLGLTEDALMTLRLHRAGIPVNCSELPTVRYTMGGYSNENLEDVALQEA